MKELSTSDHVGQVSGKVVLLDELAHAVQLAARAPQRSLHVRAVGPLVALDIFVHLVDELGRGVVLGRSKLCQQRSDLTTHENAGAALCRELIEQVVLQRTRALLIERQARDELLDLDGILAALFQAAFDLGDLRVDVALLPLQVGNGPGAIGGDGEQRHKQRDDHLLEPPRGLLDARMQEFAKDHGGLIGFAPPPRRAHFLQSFGDKRFVIDPAPAGACPLLPLLEG